MYVLFVLEDILYNFYLIFMVRQKVSSTFFIIGKLPSFTRVLIVL